MLTSTFKVNNNLIKNIHNATFKFDNRSWSDFINKSWLSNFYILKVPDEAYSGNGAELIEGDYHVIYEQLYVIRFRIRQRSGLICDIVYLQKRPLETYTCTLFCRLQ